MAGKYEIIWKTKNSTTTYDAGNDFNKALEKFDWQKEAKGKLSFPSILVLRENGQTIGAEKLNGVA